MKLRTIAIAGALAITGVTAGTTAPAAAQTTSDCDYVVQTFDFQLSYCYDLRGDCAFYVKRSDKETTTTICLAPRPV